MEFLPGVTAGDLPAPPTIDEVARRFAVPLATFAPQDPVEESAVATVGHGGTLVEVALSYTFWRNPTDRDDPVNLLELTRELRAALDTEPPGPLPGWLVESRERMRYPMLWEAVRTTRVDLDVRAEHETPAAILVHHVNHILTNTFRDERVRGGFPGELLGPATERAVEHGIPVAVDGADVDGLRFDTDAHVVGVAVDLGTRVISAVVDRDLAMHLDLSFATRR